MRTQRTVSEAVALLPSSSNTSLGSRREREGGPLKVGMGVGRNQIESMKFELRIEKLLHGDTFFSSSASLGCPLKWGLRRCQTLTL
jgi:hypothetical protein